jgi:uncharacterized protein
MTFIDTSFWVALRNVRDQRHREAVELFERYADSGLVTSNHVCGETWTFLRKRAGHGSAVSFLDQIGRSPRLRIVSVTQEQEAEALKWLRRQDEREYSFVDATSFVVMRSERISDSLAFDGDFAAAGFVELRS